MLYGVKKNTRFYVQPDAGQTEAIGVHGEELKIKLAAPPVDGKANRALAKFSAKRFNVPLVRITLKRGAQSRHKVVEIYQSVNDPEVLFNEIRTE